MLMKKFAFMLLSAFIAVSAEASDLKHLMTEPTVKSQVQLGQKFSLKQAPGRSSRLKLAHQEKL